VDASYVVSSAHRSHDRALIDFRTYVPPELLEQYDQIVEHFKSVREHAQPAMLSFYERQVTGKVSGSTREEITAAVERIFSFARS